MKLTTTMLVLGCGVLAIHVVLPLASCSKRKADPAASATEPAPTEPAPEEPGEELPPLDLAGFLKNGDFETPGESFALASWVWEHAYSVPQACYSLATDAISGRHALRIEIPREVLPAGGRSSQIRQALSYDALQERDLILRGYFKIIERGMSQIGFTMRQRSTAGPLANALSQQYDVVDAEPGKWHEFTIRFRIDAEAQTGDLCFALHVDPDLFSPDRAAAVAVFDGFAVFPAENFRYGVER